jgi:hypothetical protein
MTFRQSADSESHGLEVVEQYRSVAKRLIDPAFEEHIVVALINRAVK